MISPDLLSDLAAAAATRLAGTIVDDAVRRSTDARSARKASRAAASREEEQVLHHLRDAVGWAAPVQIRGMRAPVSTIDASVPLDMATVARRYRDTELERDLTENDLLTAPGHFILLGDPGAGKTTTMKRLVLATIGLIGETDHSFEMPVVVVCRDHEFDDVRIWSLLLERCAVDVQLPPNFFVLPKPRNEREAISQQKALDRKIENTLIRPLVTALNRMKAVILIDGLDEIPIAKERSRVATDLQTLGRRLDAAKLIVSCRSGDAPHIEGFANAELVGLSTQQIRAIVKERTKRPRKFSEATKRSGVAEMMNRPLFLEQLLLVFENTGSLPDRPCLLTRQLVRLLVSTWEEQRPVRASAYANFDNETKREFLAALSYELTISNQIKFSEDDLVRVYGRIHHRFGLPRGSAQKVAREIQSHIGIISATYSGFEFTHLTMQEYLCAEFIVRMPFTRKLGEYLATYPGPVAVAVALSTDPSEWLFECVRQSAYLHPKVDEFVERLASERPAFEPSAKLGHAIVQLSWDSSSPSAWLGLLKLPHVTESIAMAKPIFRLTERGSEVYFQYAVDVNGHDWGKRSLKHVWPAQSDGGTCRADVWEVISA